MTEVTDIANAVMNDQRQARQLAVGALDDNPDEAARAQQLQYETGVPASVIHGDLDSFERNHKAQLNNEIIARNPILQEYINSEPMAARVSHDDFHQLDSATDVISKLDIAPSVLGIPVRSSTASRAAEGFREGFGSFRWPWEMAEWISPEDVKNYPNLSALASMGGYGLENFLKLLSAGTHAVPPLVEDQLKEFGLGDADAKYYARQVGGLVEWKLQDTAAHGIAAPEGAPKGTPILKELDKMSEALTAARPYIENGQPVPVGVHPFFDDAIKENSRNDLQSLDEALRESAKSKTRERSPELFSNIVKQVVGNGKIEIDAEAVRRLYGEDVPEPEDGKLGWVPNLRSQLETAENYGGSVEIPLSEWLARVEPEIARELREDIRVRPQGLTLNEIKDLTERGKEEAARKEEALEPEGQPPSTDEVEAVRRSAGLDNLYDAALPEGWERIEPTMFPKLLPEEAELGGTVEHTSGENTKIIVPRIAGTTLRELMNKLDPADMPEALMKFFGNRLKEQVGDTPVHIVSEANMAKLLEQRKLEKAAPGYYAPLYNHIVLMHDYVDGSMPGWLSSRIIVHEAEHALSSTALLKYPVLDAAVKQLMRDTDEYLGGKDSKARKAFDYAFKNSREFMAEVKSRPALQKWLAMTPASKEAVATAEKIAKAMGITSKIRSAWDALKIIMKDLYRQMFGRVPEDSVLDQVFKLSEILEKANQSLEGMAKEKGVGKGDLLRPDMAETAEPAESLDRPLFGKMAIGMNKQWQERYFKLIEKRNAEDMERQFQKAEKEERQRQTEQWKQDTANTYREVQNDLQGRPDIAIGTFFNEGKLHGVKVSLTPKLDSTKLSPEQKELLPKTTWGRGGINPDDLAGAFGLRSGDELVQILSQMSAAKGEAPFREYVRQITQKEVARRMAAKYGQLEENIMNEAIEHVLGQTQMDLLHEEMVGLAMQTGRTLPFTKEDTKALAQRKIENTPVGQITVEKMLRDAGKAGTDAELALLDNKPAEALKSKQQQAIAMNMAREAQKFEKEQRGFEKLAKQYSQREVKSTLPEYINFIHQILMQIGRPVRRSVQDLQAAISASGYRDLEGFVDAKEGALREMPVAEFLFDPAFKKMTDDMTVGEFRAVMNSIKTLAHNGKDEMKIIREGEARDLEDVLTEMKGKLDDLGKDKTPRIDRKLNPIFRTIRTYWASSLTTESLLNRWDKDDPRGIFNRFIVYPLAEAANHEAKLIREYQKSLREAAGDIGDIDKKIDNDLFKDPLTGDFFEMRKRNLLAILQNIGNRSNLDKLAKGYGLDPAQVVQWVVSKTTKEDWDRAQRVGDVFAKLSDMADTMAQNLSGVTFERIPLESISTPYGTYRGWYNPIKYDPNRPGRSKRLIGPNALEEEGYFRATTPQGYTKGRTGYIAPLELNLDIVPQRIKQMIHDIAFRPAVVQTSKVFYDSAFQKSVIKNYGEVYAKQLVPYLKDVANFANTGSDAAATGGRAIEFFRQNLIATLIGFNPHTVAKHGMTAALNSLTEVGPANFMRELSGLMMNSEEAGKTNWQFAMTHSEELQRRMRNWRDLIQGEPEISLMRASPRDFLIAAGATPVAVGDLLSAVPTWLARYRSSIEEGTDHGQSVAEANRAVRRAHGSSVITNRSQIQRANGLAATFSSLYGFFSHMLQKQFELSWKASDSFQGVKAGDLSALKQHYPALLMGFMSYVIFPAIVEELVTPYSGADRDSWGVKAAKVLVKGISSSLIGVRDFADAVVNWREPQAGLIPTFFKTGTDLARDLSKGSKAMNREEAGRVIKHTFALTGALTGLTNAQEGRTAQFLYRYNQGLEHPKGPWDWMRGATRGTLREYRR